MANKKAIGTVNSKKVGKMREKSLAVWNRGTPRVMTNSINFRMRAINRINVKTRRPKKKGGRTSEIK
jgi:hypothetical protein